MSTLIDDLDEMLGFGEWDEDCVRPTSYAIERARELLGDVPPATIYPFGNGGLRVEWLGGEKELRLSIPDSPDDKGYIYHECGDDFDCEYEVTAENLDRWLRWYSDTPTHPQVRRLP